MTKSSAFDPLEDVLLAQTERPPELQEVNPRTLTPFQRALLVLDGTVTKFVEAYMMEPLRIVRLKQDTRTLAGPHRWLEVPAGAEVATRHVLLRGEYSDELYAYATSLVALERIPESLRAGIAQQGGGLGRILDASEAETRREILWYGRERVKDLPWDPESEGEDFLTRTYRIILAGEPILLIKEHFPLGERLLPEHH
jgi:chorismate-pyruvate lyase